MTLIPCDKCQKQIPESDAIYKGGKNFCSVACSLGAEDSLKNISWTPKELDKDFQFSSSNKPQSAPAQKLTPEQNASQGCAMGCLGIFILAILWSGFSSTCSSGQQSAPPPAVEQTQPQGGTLHKADGNAWLSADQTNRLLTAEDYVAAINPNLSESERKMRAVSLASCITEAVKGDPNQKASEVGAVCALMLKIKQ